jgi:hypothetical protein
MVTGVDGAFLRVEFDVIPLQPAQLLAANAPAAPLLPDHTLETARESQPY